MSYLSRSAFVNVGLFRSLPSQPLRLRFRPRPYFLSPFHRSYPLPRHLSRNYNMPEPVATAAEPTAQTTTPPAPPVKYLKDYAPPPYFITNARLEFSLDDDGLDTRVRGILNLRRSTNSNLPLILDGEDLRLVSDSLKINDQVIPSSSFNYDQIAHTLTIDPSVLPSDETFQFESQVIIRPAKNTALDGLYMSAGDYCTQCEAEGFRRITFYVDRPDVMATFQVKVEADRTKYPVLLSNGNCIERGDAVDGRHWAMFDDPFPKPCYLFALVAGDLSVLEDKFTTMGGKQVDLRVFVKGQTEVHKCHHAMTSLKKAMKWDEEVYGLEYNFDVFNIVAVPSFVFGAMENTSLNIFNSKYVLVSSKTATDTDFNNVEGVVAHEYFHNYTGNRVTVNSWFELSLKEGLTVFRDQSFSADMNSATVKRIRDVSILRIAQFAEDAGPMAHPIRPTSYITCNSFYTPTVYNKGAEVIRMLKTIVGPEGFRRGTDNYFKRNIGKAITTQDWVDAIQEVNPQVDLTVFRNWYSHSGTPIVTVDLKYDESSSIMTLNCTQEIPSTPKQPNAEPLFIPLRMGLIGPDGKPVAVDLGDGTEPQLTRVLNFDKKSDSFKLHNVPNGTVPSLLREFSAPIKLNRVGGISNEELAFLMANDTDEFNRWESGQKLALNFILDCINLPEGQEFADLPTSIIDAFKQTLTNENIDAALRAEVFQLPAESYIIEQVSVADPVRIRAARKHVRKQLAQHLETEFQTVLEKNPSQDEYKLDPVSQGNRVLKNVALSYLATLERNDIYKVCLETVREGPNMTEVLAALASLSSINCEERETALAEFYNQWQSDYLVVDKWLRIQATSSSEDVLDVVKGLTSHKAYNETVPNSVYALIGGYGATNVHIPTDGSGYEFLADQVLRIDRFNPQVAARIAKPFTRWRKYDNVRQSQMEVQLRKIKNSDTLSKDVFEVVKNCLDQAS